MGKNYDIVLLTYRRQLTVAGSEHITCVAAVHIMLSGHASYKRLEKLPTS
jgi:hypothetical protein